MNDKREYPRVLMPKTVHVINQMTGEEFAQVVNLSENGLLLVGRQAMEVGAIFQLELVITELGFKAPIGAECVWAEPQKTNLIFGGFRIIDVAEGDLQQLQSLILQSVTD
mgnify:CR=1 FL=1